MIFLSRIVEQQGMEGQYYDLGKDFALFRRSIDGSFEQIKTKFEQVIGSKLVGKRVRARASRGFKQYVKDYEFDVTKITLDDYYDNYVVVAHDNATPKPKEYFLKPGFKVTIIGPATGEPSPQKGGKPTETTPKVQPASSQLNPNATFQSQQMTPAPVGSGETPNDSPVKEDTHSTTPPKGDHYDAYSVDSIELEIGPWLKRLLLKPETSIRDFIPKIGWMKNIGHGSSVAMFDLKIPINALKQRINPTIISTILGNRSKNETTYELKNMEYDKIAKEWNVRIKKTVAGPI